MGIRIGGAETGWIATFIASLLGDPRGTLGAGAEFVAVDVDSEGNS